MAGDDPPAAAASDTFELVANETRLAILRELTDRRRVNWRWEGLSFADLRRAVGAEDAGTFSYHLDKLVGSFVVKDGDEYVVRNNGMELVGAIEAGTYAEWGVEPERAETDFECPVPDCNAALVARYREHYFRLACPEHDILQEAILPPGVAEHSDVTELARIAANRNRREIQHARDGVCPHCWGATETTCPDPDPYFWSDGDPPDDAVFVSFDCRRCGFAFSLPPGAFVADHPAVVSLYHEHGVDIRERPYAALPFLSVRAASVTSTDPARVRVDVGLEGDELSLWLDGDARVVEYELA